MIGLFTKGEFAAVLICLLTEIVGLVLTVATDAVVAAGVLIVVAAGLQVAIALHVMRRRKAQGVLRSGRP